MISELGGVRMHRFDAMDKVQIITMILQLLILTKLILS